MENKTMQKEQANYRIDTDAKNSAYAVLHEIGIKPTDAVNMLMRHIAMFGELPFRPKIPNEETLKTFENTDNDKQLTCHDSVDDIFKGLNI